MLLLNGDKTKSTAEDARIINERLSDADQHVSHPQGNQGSPIQHITVCANSIEAAQNITIESMLGGLVAEPPRLASGKFSSCIKPC